MTILICGSLAYDNIMVFPDQFKNHILPEQIHILNVAFLVPEMRREFGGCAGNIAYNLKLLEGEPLIMATVGDDAAPYFNRLQKLNLSSSYVQQISGSFTAQAFITTDRDDNQITAFHPGAMSFSHHNKITDALPGTPVKLAIVAPDGRDGMLQHAHDCHAAGIPFVFDPGQGMPMFGSDELLQFIRMANYACFNDYEAKLACERTGKTLPSLASELEALIVTQGGEGSDIYTAGQRIHIAPTPPVAVQDPTGCGDAYRAGLLYGIYAGWDWRQSGQLASVLGTIKIASRGGQNHSTDRAEISLLYRQAYGEQISW